MTAATTAAEPGTTRWQRFPGPGFVELNGGWKTIVSDGAGHFFLGRVTGSRIREYSLDQYDSATGSLLWTRSIYQSDEGGAQLLGATAAGSVYVNLWLPYDDSRLTKLGPDGTQQWSVPVHNVFVSAVTPDDGVLITDSTDSGPPTTNAELVRYDATGARVWSESLPVPAGANSMAVTQLAVDPSGDMLVGAELSGTVIWNGHTFGPVDHETPVLLKLSPSGALLWTHELDGLTGNLYSMGTSASGTLVALMATEGGSTSFGTGSISPGLDLIVVESGGAPRWAKNLTPDATPYRASLAVDPSGEASVSWSHDTTGCTSEVREVNLAGDALWSRHFTESQSCQDALMNPQVAVGADHEVGLAGMFTGSLDFGLGTTTSANPQIFLLGIANGAPDQNAGGSSPLVAVVKFDGSDGQGAAPDVEDLDGTSSYSTDPDVWIAACHWDFGDGATSSDCWVEHTYSSAGTYHPTLTVTGSDGSTSSASVEVDVTDSSGGTSGGSGSSSVVAVVNFDGSDGQGAAPDVEDLDGTASYSTDPNVWIADCYWEFGDGSTSNDCWVEHTYSAAGTYHPTLTVTGSDGSTSSASVEVDVTGP